MYMMPEGAPRFESFESSHSPERDSTKVELTPTFCGVRIKLREWDDRAPARIFKKGTYMSVHMRCDTCPAVKMDETLHADHTDKDIAATRTQLKQDAVTVFLSGCSKLSESEKQDPSNIPQELR